MLICVLPRWQEQAATGADNNKYKVEGKDAEESEDNVAVAIISMLSPQSICAGVAALPGDSWTD